MSSATVTEDVELDQFEIGPTSDLANLTPGVRWRPRGGRRVVFQRDGNLVIYDEDQQALWASGTHNRDVGRLAMQGDGNLVIYTRDDTPIWASDTPGFPGAFLAISSDGNLIVMFGEGAGARPIWSAMP